MNRLAGIAVAASGFLLAVLGLTNVVHGLTGTGVFMILWGGLIIGLSFVTKPEADDSIRMSTATTLINIFVAPADVFRNLRRHPRWLIAVFIMAILSATYSNLFLYRLTPDRVTNFTIDKTLGMPMMNDEGRRRIEGGRTQSLADNKNPVIKAGQVFSTFGGHVIGFSFLALIFFLFALAMGGKLNFWQAFSAAVYAYFPISVLRFALNTTLLFLKDPTDIHPITGQSSLIQDNLNFLVLPSEHPMVYALLGSLSLIGFYWVWLNGVALKNAGEKVTGTISWIAAISVYCVLILFGVALAAVFPGFIS